MRYRWLGIITALFFALSVTCSLHEGTLVTYGSAALEWGVKIGLMTAITMLIKFIMTMRTGAQYNYTTREASHARQV